MRVVRDQYNGLLILSGLIARETKAYLDFDPTLRATPEQVKQFLIDSGNPWRTDPHKAIDIPHEAQSAK